MTETERTPLAEDKRWKTMSKMIDTIMELQEQVMEDMKNSPSQEQSKLIALEWPLLDKAREAISEVWKLYGERR